MLFANSIAVECLLDFHWFHHIGNNGIKQIVIQLPDEPIAPDEWCDMLKVCQLSLFAVRAPRSMGLGTNAFSLDSWQKWLSSISAVLPRGGKLICHGASIPLGLIFEYLDKRPTDFHALNDFKTDYVKRIILQLQQIKKMADDLEIELLIENTPMGEEAYFEPGRSLLYPALRTPRHLLSIAETTGAKICFDTANARITSNALTYMHRSRSLFAGATEQEILGATSTWINFYQQVKTQTGLICLSYAISWGDTSDANHIPFPDSAYSELIHFAEQVDEQIPIVLAAKNDKNGFKAMLDSLHQLKKS